MDASDLLSALGPLAPLYVDPEVIVIMVDAPDRVVIERQNELLDAGVQFESGQALRQVIDALLGLGGGTLSPEETVGEVRFPDGMARALIVLPPTAVQGPCLVIRKTPPHPISWEDIIHFGAASQEVYDLIYGAVRVPVNILVTGGMGSGKTTILNRIAEIIPEKERLVIVEGSFHELQIRHPRMVTLEAGGPVKVAMVDLLLTGAKMRPDWLIIGELLGSEALRAIEILGRGHSGMTTLHANSAEDALARLETMCLMANVGLGLAEIRALIAAAFQLITCQHKLSNGKRRITQVVELCGLEDNHYLLQPLFRYNPETDRMEWSGVKPTWQKT